MIKAIIFDFGGVVSVGKFFPVVSAALGRQYGIDEEIIRKKLYAHEAAYMAGKEDTQTFWQNVCGDLDIPYDDFVRIFGSSYTLNPDMLDFIRTLRRRYQVVLHSDNFDALTAALRRDRRLEGLFEKMYFSNEIHLLKKEEASFRHVLEDIGKEPGQCVFIDDKEASLIAPRSIGMHTVLFKDMPQLQEELSLLGVSAA